MRLECCIHAPLVGGRDAVALLLSGAVWQPNCNGDTTAVIVQRAIKRRIIIHIIPASAHSNPFVNIVYFGTIGTSDPTANQQPAKSC